MTAATIPAAPFNLYDAVAGVPTISDAPRQPESHEVRCYLDWCAKRAGVAVSDDAVYRLDGIYEGTELIVPMPGFGQSQTVTCELLDDAGEVESRIVLPPIQKGRGAGGLPMTPAQCAKWTGLKRVRKPGRKATAKAASTAQAIVAPSEPALTAPAAPAAPVAVADDLAAIVARLASRVASLERAASGGRVRTEAHRRAVLRAWRMRAEMRARADLDRRALIAANAYNATLQGYLSEAEDRIISTGEELAAMSEARAAIAVELADVRAEVSDLYRIAAAEEARANRAEDRSRDRSRTATRLALARADRRSAQRELRGVQTGLALAQEELQRLAPISAMIAAMIPAAAPVAEKGLHLVTAAA